jgi:spore germination cell wall hydrolase CwlJ-like protein
MKIVKRAAALLAGTLLSGMLLANTAYGASYTVAKNDSLYSIGQLFGTSANTVLADNKLSSSTIYPGQVLYVRASVYTVKSGDTLYLIARKYGITTDALKRANAITGSMIYPGQKLNIPAGGTAAQATTAKAASAGAVSYTQAELDLLARLVTAEAEDQPYSAQVGVAAVVVNRVKSDLFPNTITSVVYQKSDGYYQFTPVENGWINKQATATARKAALEALNGSDPSNGALYYFDDSATNKWLWSKPLKAYIGNMVFVY